MKLISALLALTSACLAQVSTGTISGSVRDSTGGAVVGAKITITSQATSEQRQTVSNDRGEFSAAYLNVGTYSVTVTMTGFKAEVNNGIVLQVDKVVNLPFV